MNVCSEQSGQIPLREPPVFQFETERFLRVCRYARCSLDLPLLFLNALSLWDRQKGGNSFHLLSQFRAVCHEWLCLAREVGRLFHRLSLFGEQMADFCNNEIAAIRAFPVVKQCKTGILSEDMRGRLFQMYQQTKSTERESVRFREKVDDIRRQMENEIQPQAAVFGEMMEAQPSLVFHNQWKKLEIPHCDFLKENPVVSAFLRNLEDASSEEETERIWEGLSRTVQPLWQEVSDAFGCVGSMDGELTQISADINEWSTLWAAVGQYLDSMKQALSAAADSERLLLIRSALECSVSQWENLSRLCGDFAAQLETEQEREAV